jgi:hypothetical protein
MTQAVTVLIRADALVEPGESFSLDLTAAVNATLGSTSAVCVIRDSTVPALALAGGESPAGLVLEASWSEGALRLRFPTQVGRAYFIERSEHPSAGGPWFPLEVGGSGAIVGTGAMVEVWDREAGARLRSFYRVRGR